jgi:c(7)-type cytochrome triheme protein
MRKGIALATAIGLVLAVSMVLAEDKKEAPAQIVYEAKNGPVTFDHAKHVEAAKKDCKACHPGIFAQARGDLGYKGGMHKKAEADKTSCGACHHPGGASFESKGNCAKCHQKK